jgi:predicted negative regulator of RcsB-dependent stress response
LQTPPNGRKAYNPTINQSKHMASHLDLEEQEQIDQLKHFWKQYGNLVTRVLLVVAMAVVGWNVYQYWQRNQAIKAAAMMDEVERFVRSGDVEKAERAFVDMREKFPRTVYTQQVGLMIAKVATDAGKADVAGTALQWVARNADDEAYAALAQLRLAGLHLEGKKYDEALKTLEQIKAVEFAGLVADRRGDVLLAQGKAEDAKAAFILAYQGLDDRTEYRKLVKIKLHALGGSVEGDN